MLNINLNWKAAYKSRIAPQSDNWIFDVTWVDRDGELTKDPGLYIITDDQGEYVYAGQARNWAERFRKRNRVLREFRRVYRNTNPLKDYTVRLAEVEPRTALSTAEKWLVRVLFEQQPANALLLQNIRLIWAFTAEQDLVITNTNRTTKPSYLNPRYAYSKGDAV